MHFTFTCLGHKTRSLFLTSAVKISKPRVVDFFLKNKRKSKPSGLSKFGFIRRPTYLKSEHERLTRETYLYIVLFSEGAIKMKIWIESSKRDAMLEYWS